MTDTAVALPELEESEARDLTDRIASNVENLWQLIGEAYSRRAWSALGYTSWEGYTETEFGMSRGQAYRLVDQARTVAALEDAAGLKPGELGADVVSARAAADLKPVLDEVASEVAEQTRGRRRADRPAVVTDVVERTRARQQSQRSTTASKATATPAAAAPKPVDMSLDAVLGALLKHPPVEVKELSNNRWAKVRSWVKQAEAIRNPIDVKATETTSKRSSSKSNSGKVDEHCKHPANRRLGDQCAACGATVK